MAENPDFLSPVTSFERGKLLGQRGLVVWMTGLSGAGKTTIAVQVERKLISAGRLAYRLDGDDLRSGINAGLGFSQADRMENIRRAAWIARILHDAGIITLACFISPEEPMRALARRLVPNGAFLEVYVRASLETCIQRDPKGNYQKAIKGQLAGYTGLSPDQSYQEPTKPDLLLNTELNNSQTCAEILFAMIINKINEPAR